MVPKTGNYISSPTTLVRVGRSKTTILPHLPPKKTIVVPSKREIMNPQPRRQLFSSFWRKQSDDEMTSRSVAAEPEVDILRFSPPPEFQTRLRDYHSLIEDYPDGSIPGASNLPPVPLSLRRLNSVSKGMYPMVSPRSILRQPKYTTTSKAADAELTKEDEGSGAKTPPKDMGIPTRPRSYEDLVEFTHVPKSTLRRARTNLAKGAKVLRFDPRVVVTAFDDPVERYWYTGEELHGFKLNTLKLAQHCILFIPQIAKTATQASIHPVTGEKRKNNVFTLPLLSSLPEEIDFGSHMKHVEVTLRESVKKVLVVDPNKAILKLFCKSIHKLFPHARIFPSQTGEDGLKQYTKELARKGHYQDGGFDIIIVEERLFRPCKKASVQKQAAAVANKPSTQARTLSGARSFSALNILSKPGDKEDDMRKLSSFAHLDMLSSAFRESSNEAPTRMCGSQLLKKIRELENQVYGPEPTCANHKALLIGVSVNADRDRKLLHESGADIVWGKPPPPMGISLRNQLLSVLLTKRQDPSLALSIPEFAGDS